MTTKETSSYIKGLIDGSNLDVTTPEGKIIAALADLCGKLAAEVDSLTEQMDTVNDYLDEIDHDLGDVEEFVYEDEDDEEDDDEGCCGRCGRHHRFFDDDEDDEEDDDLDLDDDGDEDEEEDGEEEFYCAECPNCGGKVYFDDTVNPEDVICPNCHKPLIDDEDDLDEEDEDLEP
jgi:hypothetical protein